MRGRSLLFISDIICHITIGTHLFVNQVLSCRFLVVHIALPLSTTNQNNGYIGKLLIGNCPHSMLQFSTFVVLTSKNNILEYQSYWFCLKVYISVDNMNVSTCKFTELVIPERCITYRYLYRLNSPDVA